MSRLYAVFSKLHARQMLLVAIILVPSLAMLFMQAFEDRKHAEDNLALQARMMGLQIGMYAKELLPDPEMYLSQLAQLPELFDEQSDCNAVMAASLRADFFFHNLFIAAPDGELICSGIPLTKPLNVSSRSYFQRVMLTNKFAVGDFQLTLRDQIPVIVFAMPIPDDRGNVKAVIGASVKLTWFQDAFSHAVTNTGAAGIAAVAVDESGIVIASAPDARYAGQPARNWNSAIREKAKETLHVASETWRSGTVRTTANLALYRSTSANIYLRVGVPQAEAFALVRQQNQRRFALLIAFACAAVLAAWFLGAWLIVKPLRRLKETAALLGNGKLDARAGLLKSDGEISELAAHFDMMAERIEAQHNALSRMTRFQALRGEVNAAVLRARNEQALLNDVCEIVRKIGDFDCAWAGYVDGDNLSTLNPRAWSAANPAARSRLMNRLWSSDVKRSEPVFRAVASGEVCVIRDSAEGTPDDEWPRTFAELGCKAAIGLPIMTAGAIIGGLAIYSADAGAFDQAQVKMLRETASDLGFGIAALRAEAERQEGQDLLNMIVSNIPTMIFVKEARSLRYISMNRAGEILTGLKERDFIGKTDFDLFSKDAASAFRANDQVALGAEQALTVTEQAVNSVDGEARLVETKKLRLLGKDGLPKYLLGISEDITHRRQAEQRLHFLAAHDHLTGLVNRHGLQLAFQAISAQTAAEAGGLTLLYIDLDGFKEINDTLGHPIGDELLKTVAHLLRNSVAQEHTVARVGGDEFIILLRDQGGGASAEPLAEEIRARCEKPFHVEGHEIFISASIGISRYPDVASHDELLRAADIAMYQAKAKGRNAHAVYSPDMHGEALTRLEMRNYLRHAIDHNELTMHYQPRVSMSTGRIVGAEALLRWHSNHLGAISPGLFIPLAEESGLIVQIGDWVLRHACTQARAWQDAGNGAIRLAVNLSPRQLRQASLLDTVSEVLAQSGLSPELLELEVTESALMDRGSKSIELLNQIAGMGVRIAVDDFGTGYSNLGYLKQLPLNVLKVDQSFIRGITSNSSDLAIVTAIVAMATSLSLSVTAEGIETPDQLEAVRHLGIVDYQGFYFSKPVPATEFSALLLKQRDQALRPDS